MTSSIARPMFVAVVSGIWLVAALATAEPSDRKSIEQALRTGRVTELRHIGSGVTRPQIATIKTGEGAIRGVWKTVDIYQPLKRFDDGGFPVLGFRDSYKHEIAAYELDKLLGLRLVPPTVERRIRSEKGSMQLFVEGTITEQERLDRGLSAPDLAAWNRGIYTLRVWHQLVDDSDYNNIGNVLVDAEFNIYCIDHSRAFRLNHELMAPRDMKRFSSALLDGLRGLDSATATRGLKRWLTRKQIEALLARRDAILEVAAARVREQGEDVLFP